MASVDGSKVPSRRKRSEEENVGITGGTDGGMAVMEDGQGNEGHGGKAG